MLASTQVAIPAEWLAILGILVPVAIYLVRRRDAQSSTLTESKVLTEKSVKNIEEQWQNMDAVKDRISELESRVAFLEGAHAAKGCFPVKEIP